MPSGFMATRVSVAEENEVLVVTLSAESSEEEDFYLMLQHRDHRSPQDARSGMDQPYIEYCGQGWSWYGHIEWFELRRDGVEVRLDSKAALHMRNDGLIAVAFRLEDDEFHGLRQALGRIFRDRRYFTEQLAI